MEGQFEPQILNQPYIDQNPSQNFEPQIQPYPEQTPQEFEPQINQQYEPQVQTFEAQNQNEPQIQIVDEAQPINKPQADAQYENQYEPQVNNYVEPMIEQTPSLTDTNNSSNAIVLENRTFSMHKVFIFYIVQTVVYIVFCRFNLLNPEMEVYWPTIIFAVAGVILFGAIRCYDEKFDNNACSIIVYIYFFIFKILFFIYIYFIVSKVNIDHIYCTPTASISGIFSNKTIFGNFDFAHLALFVYYLTLSILTYCYKLQLLIYFIIGLAITIIMFCSLIAINIAFAGYTALFIFLEISILLLVLKIAIHQKKLDENKFLNNLIILDYYKYAVIMLISFIILTIFIYIIYCMCLCLKYFCQKCTSQASTVDNDGNVYDQYNVKIGHFSTKPKYVDSAGNVYDKHHNKIEPDCIVF